MKNPYEKYYKAIEHRHFGKTYKDNNGQKLEYQIDYNVTRYVKKTIFGKEKRYLKFEVFVLYEDKIKVSTIKIRVK